MSASPPDQRPGILVVDDTPANLQVLTSMLRNSGYRPRPVLSGRQALQAAEADPPDLVLLDLCMPEMDGIEVCRRLKEIPRLKSIPVLFISALTDTADKLHAFAAGGVDYVTKPFQFAEVEARVHTHLELSRLQREREARNAQLEALVQVRTRELQQAHARLATLDKDKADFLQLISHELRTPLHGLFGVTDLLFNQARQRLLTVLDDALLLTQLKVSDPGHQAEIEDLDPLLAAARDQTAAFAAERQVQVPANPSGITRILADPDLLRHALASLLTTAIRFAHPGSPLSIAGSTAGPEATLHITATGRAIPPALLPRFFDVLAINEAIVPGADLGLAPAVAERVISGFGGTLTVESLTPPGICLTVRLRRPPS